MSLSYELIVVAGPMKGERFPLSPDRPSRIGRAARGVTLTLDDKANLMLAGTHAADTVAKVTEMVHRLAGTSGIYETSRIERHFRDAHTLRHHGLVCPNRFETVGQVYLDVEPEFPFVHL